MLAELYENHISENCGCSSKPHTRGYHSGTDLGRSDRCKCIGQKKITDAFIGQIFTANNEKRHFFAKIQGL